jgi:hypothetical protein
MITCEFCNKTFVTRYTMLKHQQTTKKCLVIQSSQPVRRAVPSPVQPQLPTYPCIYCDIIYHKVAAYNKHTMVCSNKDKYYNAIITDLTKTVDRSKVECGELKAVNTHILTQFDSMKDEIRRLQEVVNSIAQQPRHTTNNTVNNTILNMTVYNPQISNVRTMIANDFHEPDMVNYPESVIDWVHKYILTDKVGRPMWCCTDPSRYMFKYHTLNGDIGRDPGASDMLTMLYEAGLLERTGAIAIACTKPQRALFLQDVHHKMLTARDKPAPWRRQLLTKYIDSSASLPQTVVDEDLDYIIESDGDDDDGAAWRSLEYEIAYRNGIAEYS